MQHAHAQNSTDTHESYTYTNAHNTHMSTHTQHTHTIHMHAGMHAHTCTHITHTYTHTSEQTPVEQTYQRQIRNNDPTHATALGGLCSLCLSSVKGSSPPETALPYLLNASLRAPAVERGSEVTLPCAEASGFPLASLGAGRRRRVDALASEGEGSTKCSSNIASCTSLVSKSLSSPLSEFEAMVDSTAAQKLSPVRLERAKG